MKKDTRALKKAEQILKHALMTSQAPPVSYKWQRRVMSHIQQFAHVSDVSDNAKSIATAWRFAAATSLSALILLLYSLNAGIGPEHEAARMFLYDPLGFIVSQFFLP